MSFSPTFLTILVLAALAVTTLGVALLIVLLVRDIKDGKSW
jgi:hypothetical protein